jgi:tRNA pseudouridine55 synthase
MTLSHSHKNLQHQEHIEGILLVNKPKGKTSFSLVAALRKHLKVKKIGHAGTLDPLATGIMVMLIGKNFTKRSGEFLGRDKEYLADIHLGISTDTYDSEGEVIQRSDKVPTLEELLEGIKKFQGTMEQIPPMFSAKKIQGKRLYDLARKGIVVKREPVRVDLNTQLLSYAYPIVKLRIICSKGTYIRSIAHDLGSLLCCGAHLTALHRVRSGTFTVENCVDGAGVISSTCDVEKLLNSLISNASES